MVPQHWREQYKYLYTVQVYADVPVYTTDAFLHLDEETFT